MSRLTLMEKIGAGQMNVPPDKVQQYLDEGWTIVIRADAAAPAVPVATEAALEESEPEAEPSSAKSKKAKK